MWNLMHDDYLGVAFDLAIPTIKAIFKDPAFVWGPELVCITVVRKGYKIPYVRWVGDRKQEWKSEWKATQDDFEKIAYWKASTALKYGIPTSELFYKHPLALVEEDFFYPGGVVNDLQTIGIGTSGINGRGDEVISSIYLSILRGVAHRFIEAKIERGVKQL